MSPGTTLGTQEEPTQMMDSLVQLQVAGQRANRLTCALGGTQHAALSSSSSSSRPGTPLPPLGSAMPGPRTPPQCRPLPPRRAPGPGAAADAGAARCSAAAAAGEDEGAAAVGGRAAAEQHAGRRPHSAPPHPSPGCWAAAAVPAALAPA